MQAGGQEFESLRLHSREAGGTYLENRIPKTTENQKTSPEKRHHGFWNLNLRKRKGKRKPWEERKRKARKGHKKNRPSAHARGDGDG